MLFSKQARGAMMLGLTIFAPMVRSTSDSSSVDAGLFTQGAHEGYITRRRDSPAVPIENQQVHVPEDHKAAAKERNTQPADTNRRRSNSAGQSTKVTKELLDKIYEQNPMRGSMAKIDEIDSDRKNYLAFISFRCNLARMFEVFNERINALNKSYKLAKTSKRKDEESSNFRGELDRTKKIAAAIYPMIDIVNNAMKAYMNGNKDADTVKGWYKFASAVGKLSIFVLQVIHLKIECKHLSEIGEEFGKGCVAAFEMDEIVGELAETAEEELEEFKTTESLLHKLKSIWGRLTHGKTGYAVKEMQKTRICVKELTDFFRDESDYFSYTSIPKTILEAMKTFKGKFTADTTLGIQWQEDKTVERMWAVTKWMRAMTGAFRKQQSTIDTQADNLAALSGELKALKEKVHSSTKRRLARCEATGVAGQ